jgi:ABC-type Zn uptake system ZnuABC Zn-binding protein ZnuA
MTLRRHRRTNGRTTARLASILAGTLLLAACGGTEDAAPTPQPAPAPAPAPEEPAIEPLSIVVTTSILGDVVAAITGDDATVRVLMGPGVDPHVYEASAADAAAMRDADLVIANGLLLEERLVSVLEAAVEDGVRVLSVGEEVDPIEFSFAFADGDAHDHDHDHDHGHSHADDDDHDHGDEDPHFWWDPMRMALATELIGTALAEARPEIDWAARVTAYNTDLMAIHEDMVTLFATIPEAKRRIITNHDSLGYLAARYDFEVIGTVIPGATTSAVTNPRDFSRLVDLVVAEGVNVIFAENTDETTLAEQLRSEAVGRGDVEVSVVRLYTDALGEPGSGAETYLGMLRTTAQLITEALTAA